MSGSAEASQKALHTSLMLLNQLENNIPLSGVLIGTLEAMIQQSKSRFAFLLHNHSGTLISEFAAHNPESPMDKEHLKTHASDILSCLLPQIRRTSPLIANSSTAVKTELSNTMAWRLFQRLLLIPLSDVMGDKKGILVLFGKPDNYTIDEIKNLGPLISLSINLLTLDEQKPSEERELISQAMPEAVKQPINEYDYQFIHSKDPRFVTSAEGVIVHHNTAAENLLAFP
ncbi:MAG: hypothetical protein R3204_13160, partial [Oceanospirillum sp.]|nr:hypothetical protein [Oceanospirillum sp.]